MQIILGSSVIIDGIVTLQMVFIWMVVSLFNVVAKIVGKDNEDI